MFNPFPDPKSVTKPLFNPCFIGTHGCELMQATLASLGTDASMPQVKISNRVIRFSFTAESTGTAETRPDVEGKKKKEGRQV